MINKERGWIVVAIIAIIYVGLRFWNLTDSCLWFDEIFGVHAAEMPFSDMIWFIAQDLIHPPFFYVLLKFWITVFGDSLFSLRFFPVLFSVAAVVPFVLLCRQLKFPVLIIAVALAFFAVNGSLIKYAQEVRMYSLFAFFALVSWWLFVRYLNTGKNLALLIIVNIFLVYTHYFGWFVIASEILAVIVLARERLLQIGVMTAITAASYLPWIYALRRASQVNFDVGQNIGWMTKPNGLIVFQFVFDLFEPIYFQNSNRDEPAIFLITLPIMAIGLIVFGFYAAQWKTQTPLEKRNFLLLLIFCMTPVVLAFAASWILPYSIWGTRHLIVVFAPFVIILALAISKIKIQALKATILGVIALLFVAALAFQATRPDGKFIWCAWENLAAKLPEQSGELTKIYVFEDLTAYHFWFALRETGNQFQVVKINGIEGLTEDKAYFLPRGFSDVQRTNKFEGERFYIAFRDRNWNEFAPPLQNLKNQNYEIGNPQIVEAQGLRAFLVEVSRKNQTIYQE